MKIEMIKQPGGVLVPASDIDAEKLTKFKSACQYPIEIKLPRNHKFHRKMFSFFQFCFAHWKGSNEFIEEHKQFDAFRKDLTICAGFYDQVFNLDGTFRLEAKSLSYGQMSEEDFRACYNACINAAMRTIFKSHDENTFNQLMSFF